MGFLSLTYCDMGNLFAKVIYGDPHLLSSVWFAWLFVCLGYFVPLENFSLILRWHHDRWTAANFDLCSALMAIEQWGFFSVPNLLSYGAFVYNGHFRWPVKHLLLSVWLSSCHYLFLRLRPVAAGIRTANFPLAKSLVVELWLSIYYVTRAKNMQWLPLMYLCSKHFENCLAIRSVLVSVFSLVYSAQSFLNSKTVWTFKGQLVKAISCLQC